MDKTTIYRIGVRNILEKTDSKTIWDCCFNVNNCGIDNGKTQLLPVKRRPNCQWKHIFVVYRSSNRTTSIVNLNYRFVDRIVS